MFNCQVSIDQGKTDVALGAHDTDGTIVPVSNPVELYVK